MEITFDRKHVSACLQQKFVLPTYQREYKWETKHIQELLTDIQEAFLDNYENHHGRSEVASYSPYFLGTIITTTLSSGEKAIVDGQQRLTTLTIIISYFQKLSKENPSLAVSHIEPLLRRTVFGANKFNIEFDEDRQKFFEIILDRSIGEDNQIVDEMVDSIPNISESTKLSYRNYTEIDNFIVDEIKSGLIAHFVDFLTEKVYLFEIGVPSEQDGHKVFVTMNDRGLKLSPIDLLKGYFLSNISNPTNNARAHSEWVKQIKKLKSYGNDEDSAFFKTWLRAQFANSSRGKSRGDAAGDFENIGDAYHRWVVDKSSELNLNNSDQYYNFVTKDLPFFVEKYVQIKEFELNYQNEFASVYHNGARDLTLQYMVILSSISVNDSNTDVEKKIKATSYYMDYYSTLRIINGKDNNYDNIRDYAFGLCKKLRNKSVSGIVDVLESEARSLDDKIDPLSKIEYGSIKRHDLLHILARVADFLEEKIEQTNKVSFSGYVDRGKNNKTFDIEHILPNNPVSVQTDLGPNYDFDNPRDFLKERNNIGALILLPRGRNRSVRAKVYSQKISIYSGENVLAQSLHSSFYENNPSLEKFLAETSAPMCKIDFFNKSSISLREELYLFIAKSIWSPDNIKQ